MLKQIYQFHQAIAQKIASTFGLSDNLIHHHRLNSPSKHVKIHATRYKMKQLHNDLHDWHKEHNKRVAEFHKNHASIIERGENGKGLLAKWERFVYNKWKALINAAR